MNLLRRVWRVYADRAGSDTARELKAVIPFVVALVAAQTVTGWRVPLATPMDVVWLCALLWVVRQRDEARAEAKAARI